MPKLEDEPSDIISKAHRGLGLSTSGLAKLSALPAADIRALRGESADPEVLKQVAPLLHLRPESLLRIFNGQYNPPQIALEGLHCIDTPAPLANYAEMRVSAFLVHLPGSKASILFDTGTSLAAVEEALTETRTELTALCITHTHWDHIEILDALIDRFPGLQVYGPKLPTKRAHTQLKGVEKLELAGLKVEVRPTRGHAADGLSYVVEGLDCPLAVVGDALFAGSIGGIPSEAYKKGLQQIKDSIFSLPDHTLVAPGHGALTSVKYERCHNPFFPS